MADGNGSAPRTARRVVKEPIAKSARFCLKAACGLQAIPHQRLMRKAELSCKARHVGSLRSRGLSQLMINGHNEQSRSLGGRKSRAPLSQEQHKTHAVRPARHADDDAIIGLKTREKAVNL